MMKPSPSSPSLADLDWLRAFAARLATPGDDDDLVQDTLLTAWQRGPTDPSDRSLRPWLASVARNRARMNARGRRRREQREQQAAAPGEASSPDADLERVRVLQVLLAAIGELDELDRKIIVRRFFHEQNATRIGEQLGMPAATVRSRLRRSIERLRADLDERHAGRRDAWCLALAGPAALPATELATMSVAIKITLGICVSSLIAAGWWWSRPDSPPVVDEPTSVEARVDEETPERRWQQRRDRIHAGLAARPEPERSDVDLDALERSVRTQAQTEFSALSRACMADLAGDASGAITLSATLIGDPEVGVVFDSVEVVTETVGDPEVLACLTESMIAYVGDPPAAAIETHYQVTMPWIGRDEDDTRKERRIFDAIVGAHYTEVAFCGREHGPDEIGELELELTVGPEQTVEHTEILATDLSTPVVECIIAASERWKFAKDLSGKMFTYGFRLPVPASESSVGKD